MGHNCATIIIIPKQKKHTCQFKCWWEYRTTRIFMCQWLEKYHIATLEKNYIKNLHLLYSSTIPVPSIQPKEIKNYVHTTTCDPMSIAFSHIQ